MALKDGSFVDGRTGKEFIQSWKSSTPNRILRWADKRIWPSYTLRSINGSLNYRIPTDGSGGLQGNHNLLGQNPGLSTNLSFDPAGGSGDFCLISRESTLWHRAAVKIAVYYTINTQSSTHLRLSKVTEFDDLNNHADESTITSLGSSSTTVSSHGSGIVEYYKVCPNGVATGNGSYGVNQELSGNDPYDMMVSFTLGPNNNATTSYGRAEIVSIYDGVDNEIQLDTPNVLFSWEQKPNLLYYVDMSFVRKPSSASESPVPATVGDYTNEYNDQSFDIFLFVEFGISIDGGQSIQWNEDWPKFLSDHGYTSIDTNKISTKVPTRFNTGAFTMSIYGSGDDYFPNNFYINSNPELYFNESDYNNIYYKYFKVNVQSKTKNDEYNNPSSRMSQRYFVDKTEFINSSDKEENRKAIANWQANSKSHLKFIVRSTITTLPWNCLVKASLNYKSGNMNYSGSTDPNERNNGSK